MQVLNFALTGPRQIIATVEMRLTLERDDVKSGESRQYVSEYTEKNGFYNCKSLIQLSQYE